MKIKHRLLSYLQAVIILIWISGCTSLPYLHSNETEIETQAIKETTINIKVDQNFEDVKKQLVSFSTREDQAIADYLISSRDKQLISLIRKDILTEHKKTTMQLLQMYVNNRFSEILGKPPKNDNELHGLRALPDLLYDIQDGLRFNLNSYNSAVREVKKNENDKRPTDCNAVLKTFEFQELNNNNPQDEPYRRLFKACEDTKETYELLTSNKKIKEINRVDYSLIIQILDKTNDMQNEIEKEKVKGKNFENLISDIEKLSKSNQSLEKELQNKIEEARKYFEIAQGFAMFSGAKKLSQSLEEVLAGTLNTTTIDDPIATKRTAAILELTDSLAGVADTFQKEPKIQRVNSLLIAIIELRQKRDRALLDINRQEDLLRIYIAQQTARVHELVQLSVTQLILNKVKGISLNGDGGGFAVIPPGPKEPSPSISVMLAAYITSWNQGQIPYKILQHKEEQVERAYLVELATVTAKNIKNLLAPALDELAAYGKGGIHPETIATLITNLGLIAAFAAR